MGSCLVEGDRTEVIYYTTPSESGAGRPIELFEYEKMPTLCAHYAVVGDRRTLGILAVDAQDESSCSSRVLLRCGL
jgi:hypothetical protein